MSTYLWQNFLKDQSVIRFIANSIASLYSDFYAKALVEIGPWKWAITKHILNVSDHFFVIEKDDTLEEGLMHLWLNKKQIIMEDVLKTDIWVHLNTRGVEESEAIVIGNLPYYITSPIFKHLFWKESPQFLWGFFMIQDEVGQKIKSDAKKKSYLWRLINRWYSVEYVKMIPAKCFSPAPKVKSCLIRVKKKRKTEAVDAHKLEDFLNLVSPYSRKTLGKISKMIEKRLGISLKIPEPLLGKRLEELGRSDLLEILW